MRFVRFAGIREKKVDKSGIFLWFIQKFDDFCYLLPGVEVGKLAGAARTEALLELGAPVDPSHQPVERYPGGSGGKVEHGELCLPVTSVFYHNLFVFSFAYQEVKGVKGVIAPYGR